jgi:hypothetical protein
MKEEMQLRVAIEQAEKFLAHIEQRKVRPPTKLEREAIQRLATHAATSAQ